MERLTVYTGCRYDVYDPIDTKYDFSEINLQKLIDKLAHYEDLEESGRLVVLPCKVGDTVYIVDEKFPAEIEEIRIHPQGIFFEYVQFDRSYELTEVWDCGSFCIDDIGKTVFLTREEAEAALKGGDRE